MIIKMRQGASLPMAEANAKTLAKAGFDVQVKNGDGKYVFAALGMGDKLLLRERLVWIESIDDDNSLFSAESSSFKEAWDFFRAK